MQLDPAGLGLPDVLNQRVWADPIFVKGCDPIYFQG